jgi:cytochrome c553
MMYQDVRVSAAAAACALALAACEPNPTRNLTEPPDDGPAARSFEERERAAEEPQASEAPIQETAQEYLARHGRDRSSPPLAADGTGTAAVAACIQCHGPDAGGREALSTPRIGGLPEWYIVRQLKYFKQGVRASTEDAVHGTQMRAVSLLLGGEEHMEDIARYIASLSPPPGDTVEGDVARGKELYGACVACHGPDGRGNTELNTPSIVEQHGEYLIRQLDHFRSGVRGMHPLDVFGQQMLPSVTETLMSRDDVVDVVAYIGSLRDQTDSTGGTEVTRSDGGDRIDNL